MRWMFGAALFVLAGEHAVADGGFWPAQAFPKMPEIPAQRAIIAFRDGVETLVVESTVASPSPKVGWIVPLPADPTEIEPVDPGIMNTAWFCTRPEVIHGEYTFRIGVLTGVASLLSLGAILAFTSIRGRRVDSQLLRLLALCVVVVVCAGSILLPHLGTGGARTIVAPGALVLQAVRAGSYDVSVLRAETPVALSEWLAANDLLALTPKAEKIVADYIAREWVFAVAVLRVREGEAAAPHPLSVTFAAAEPVYPMRLTELAGNTVDLELYVIADRRGGHALMEVEFADRYTRRGGGDPFKAYYGGRASGGIGLPELCELMWDDCVVTKLIGSLKPEQMQADLALTLNGRSTTRKTVYTEKGARETAASVGLVGLGVAALLVILCQAGYHRARMALTIGAIAFAVSVAAAAATRLALPKIDPGDTDTKKVTALLRPRFLLARWAEFSRQSEITPDMGDDAVAEAFLKWMARDGSDEELRSNPFLGGRLRREKSPGNFWLEGITGGRRFIAYGLNGRPHYMPIPLPETRPDRSSPGPSRTRPG